MRKYCPTGYPPIVCRLAAKLHQRCSRHISFDDLLQAGMIGWLRAERRYQAVNGASLDTYAGQRAKGAMLDELRSASWFPRRLRELSMVITDPTSDEYAEMMGSVTPDIGAAIDANRVLEAAKRLPKKEREPVILGGEPGEQARIARERGLSISRIAQLRTQGIARLKSAMWTT